MMARVRGGHRRAATEVAARNASRLVIPILVSVTIP